MEAGEELADPREQVAYWLAAACSRHSIHPRVLNILLRTFPAARLIRLSFGLENKVMVNVNIKLPLGTCHTSFIPIHPTAASAAVLQGNPTVVVRQSDRRSPLWDQEDVWVHEGCATLTVASMPFYWPPRDDDMLYGHPLPRPKQRHHQPTFGALSLGTQEPLQGGEDMFTFAELATLIGRYVCPHISALLAALEEGGAILEEAQAQEEILEAGEAEGEGGGWLPLPPDSRRLCSRQQRRGAGLDPAGGGG